MKTYTSITVELPIQQYNELQSFLQSNPTIAQSQFIIDAIAQYLLFHRIKSLTYLLDNIKLGDTPEILVSIKPREEK